MATLKTLDTNSAITMRCTPSALKHILGKREFAALRIRLKRAGCSGWLYKFDYGTHPEEEEIVCSVHEKLKVFILSKHAKFFNGVTLDYIKSGLNEALTCINPREVARCGCGESFTVDAPL